MTAFGADDAHFRAVTPNPPDPPLDPESDALLRHLQATAVDPIATDADDELPSGFTVWVWVRAERLDPERLVEALQAGDYYTSQGPVLHDIAIDDGAGELSIVCSPAASIFVTGRPDVFATTSRHGTLLTHATFSIAAYRGSYCRVTVVDAAGKRAWSNPFWLD